MLPNINLLEMENLAIKILFDLLFYTSKSGKERLKKQLNC